MFSCFPNVIFGLFAFLNIYFVAFLFCGMFVDPEDVVWPIRVFCYFLPLGWSLPVVHVRPVPRPRSTQARCRASPAALATGGVCTSQGFYCYSEDDPTGAVCYGDPGTDPPTPSPCSSPTDDEDARATACSSSPASALDADRVYARYHYLTKITAGGSPRRRARRRRRDDRAGDGEEHSGILGGVIAVAGQADSETQGGGGDANGAAATRSPSPARARSYSIPGGGGRRARAARAATRRLLAPDVRRRAAARRDVSREAGEGAYSPSSAPAAASTRRLATSTGGKGPGAAAGGDLPVRSRR